MVVSYLVYNTSPLPLTLSPFLTTWCWLICSVLEGQQLSQYSDLDLQKQEAMNIKVCWCNHKNRQSLLIFRYPWPSFISHTSYHINTPHQHTTSHLTTPHRHTGSISDQTRGDREVRTRRQAVLPLSLVRGQEGSPLHRLRQGKEPGGLVLCSHQGGHHGCDPEEESRYYPRGEYFVDKVMCYIIPLVARTCSRCLQCNACHTPVWGHYISYHTLCFVMLRNPKRKCVTIMRHNVNVICVPSTAVRRSAGHPARGAADLSAGVPHLPQALPQGRVRP